MEELLPIGSIIKLGKTNYTVLICGYGGRGSSNKVYDYIGIIYPYGFISKDNIISFNKEKITEVLFEGYKNKKYEKVVSEMAKDIESAKKNNGEVN